MSPTCALCCWQQCFMKLRNIVPPAVNDVSHLCSMLLAAVLYEATEHSSPAVDDVTHTSKELIRVKRSEYGAAPECKGGNQREISEKIRQPAASRTARFPCAYFVERPGQGIEPSSPRWEAKDQNASGDSGESIVGALGESIVGARRGERCRECDVTVPPPTPQPCNISSPPYHAVLCKMAAGSQLVHSASRFIGQLRRMAGNKTTPSLLVINRLTRLPYTEDEVERSCWLRTDSLSVSAASTTSRHGATVAERLACLPPQPRHAGFSHVGIVPDGAVGRWVFSGISLFLRPFIPALLRTHLLSPSSVLNTSLSAIQPNLFTHSQHASGEIWAAPYIEVLRADEGEARHGVAPEYKGGETGYPRKNPSTSGIVRHDSHV
ncbi:hypothetical protein PR048_029690 [Dryococelus australis]|uniref:Uncharacterized protein n=1 Tax=Dryococelus australis TaxID=614101 RepID=A0ABQ9GE26_9NEOP|nr:hypothetical protein PR048_029690 [Dryococelus australis]